jgi:hypothetical protein
MRHGPGGDRDFGDAFQEFRRDVGGLAADQGFEVGETQVR